MTITRAQWNTEAIEHDQDDRVQLCLHYNGVDPGDIIRDLMINYASIPAAYINQSDWNSETDKFLGRVYTALIAEPTAVVKLVNEILEQAAMTIWWDEMAQRIRLQVLRVVPAQFNYTDDYMMEGSFNQAEQQDKRISQVWTYFGQINPLDRLNDPQNYRNTLASVNLESEVNYGTPSIRTVFSRWITQFGRTAAQRLNNLMIARYRDPPKLFGFRLLRGSGVPSPSLGGGAIVESFFTQDDEGNAVSSTTQLIEVEATDSTWNVKAEEITLAAIDEQDDPTLKLVPIDVDTENFNLRDAYLQLYSEALSGDTVVCDVRSGVVVGSENTSQPSWRTGVDWPAGVTLSLLIQDGAFIVGQGGKGGNASMSFSQTIDGVVVTSMSAESGERGGRGLLAETAIAIDNGGVIGGGAGGGGGAAAHREQYSLGVLIASSYETAGGGGGASFGAHGTGFDNGKAGGLELGGDGGSYSGGILGQTEGGDGGHLGLAGAAGQPATLFTVVDSRTGSGGAAGAAVDGDSLVTWTNLGDVRGARIN